MNFKIAVKFIVFFGISFQSYSQEKIPGTINELKDSLMSILDETEVPGLGISIIQGDSNVLIAGLGKADVEKDIDVDENTLFRIGSVSKMFVSLSILKLQEEGKVSLKDKVKDLIPEIEFKNRWEDTNPILVEHLLEHTTGWDDIHLPEYALNAKGFTLKEGLDYHPHSRTSRWVPGSRMSYCNSGPAVAAYIVEKITGMAFEDYIQQTFFDPLGMDNATYYESEEYKGKGATLYSEGNPQEYWNVIMRPTGAINASPKDMAKYVRFLINRGRVDSTQIISRSSIDRMERSETTLGARVGIEIGYGLSNYSSTYESFTYHGHNGGVIGGLTELAYLPEYNFGYVFMINSDNSEAFSKISELIRAFQFKKTQSADFNVKTLSGISDRMKGLYIPINPRTQMFYFLERALNVRELKVKGDTIYFGTLIRGEPTKYVPVGKGQFASSKTGKISLVEAEDPLAGEVIQANTGVYKPVSGFVVYGLFGLIGLWLLGILSSGILGLTWVVRYLMGYIKGTANIRIRLWPLLASLTAVVTVILVMYGAMSPFERLGSLGIVSGAIFLLTLSFGVLSAISLVYVVLKRKAVTNKLVFWYCATLGALHFSISLYFMWHGVIGMRTWS